MQYALCRPILQYRFSGDRQRTTKEWCIVQACTTDSAGIGSALLKNNCAGLYYRFSGDRQRTTKEYLMADGQMSVLPVAFSLMASFMSAITLLGVTQVSSHPAVKGTVSRDFLLLVFFLNQFPPSPRVSH
jgi:hypothetical protein